MSHITPEKVIHGGALLRHRKRTGRDFIDFSASLNPFPPDVRIEFDLEEAGAYPDDCYEDLKEGISRIFQRDTAEITVGNGSVEVIRSYCASVLSPGDGVYIPQPTFGEYAMSVRLAGGVLLSEASGARVRFLCNPNNPDGELTSKDDILAILDGLRDDQCLFVDEAFIELSDPGMSVSEIRHPALFVSRSITKSFAVPGLRFGFGFGDPDLVAVMERRRLPWTVNAFSEVYARAALDHYEDLAESRRRICIERERLSDRLRALGLPPRPSSTNYLLVDLPFRAADLAASLLDWGILVRDCASFGLPSAIRVAVRTEEENRQLIEALSACLP
ncbi:pyridoxal phosphate-dependent aminotransferase [Methanofollis fontis]|uniref:L-threonine-O-3-phosphate decarboxylase n=1 Tax=Methanofollis fontis TaxID=2052832 RepID=A0A483CNN1_9EURY|nr:histidinol-phosphate transaminase [Methanofollis fontis]TAJ44662.1 L-threonine-O-3-phosphate decarboxylase [Methanofollis fontis]